MAFPYQSFRIKTERQRRKSFSVVQSTLWEDLVCRIYSSDAINDANDDGDDGNFTEKVMLMPPPAATTVAGFPSTQVAPLSADTSKSLMFPLQQAEQLRVGAK